MTLEDDLNNIYINTKPVEVSRIINEQVEILNRSPPAKLGKSTAENLLRFCKARAERGESYPTIERVAKHYLSIYGYFERLTKAFYPTRK